MVRNKPLTRAMPKPWYRHMYHRMVKSTKRHFGAWHRNRSWVDKWIEYSSYRKGRKFQFPPQKPPGSYDKAAAQYKRSHKHYKRSQKAASKLFHAYLKKH